MDINYINQDITFCLNDECPIKEYCHRGIGASPGIHSYSDFSIECNPKSVYKDFIQTSKEITEKYRRKQKQC